MRIYKRKQESKKKKKTRSRPRNQPGKWSRKKKVFSFFLVRFLGREHVFFLFSFFLNHFLGRVFLFSFINSHLRCIISSHDKLFAVFHYGNLKPLPPLTCKPPLPPFSTYPTTCRNNLTCQILDVIVLEGEAPQVELGHKAGKGLSPRQTIQICCLCMINI